MTASIESVILGDVAWTHISGRVAVLDLGTRGFEPVFLEGSAKDIWLAVAEGRRLADLVAELVATYEESTENVSAGVASFVETAVSMRILRHG